MNIGIHNPAVIPSAEIKIWKLMTFRSNDVINSSNLFLNISHRKKGSGGANYCSVVVDMRYDLNSKIYFTFRRRTHHQVSSWIRPPSALLF
mmetsp:Transcript_18674/g.38953  ORF Transcript_18674/g.38953 Transcript_18674/m.38953 type:complete len:91 (-) Transcript_18674:2419-2691(-)